jgi:acyl-CoA synthetase (AMP-forming)/AMP-acid ligase II
MKNEDSLRVPLKKQKTGILLWAIPNTQRLWRANHGRRSQSAGLQTTALFSSLVARQCFSSIVGGACAHYYLLRTGLPKGVLTTQLASIAAIYQAVGAQARKMLRRGDTFAFGIPPPTQPAFLLGVPLFHVTGGQAILLSATLIGGKIVMMQKWDVQKGVELIKKETITAVGGLGILLSLVRCVRPSLTVLCSCSIPSIALDLLENEQFVREKNSVESVSYGGAPAPPTIPKGVSKLPGALTDRYVPFCFILLFSALSLPLCFETAVVKVNNDATEECRIVSLTGSIRFPWKGYGLTETSGGCVIAFGEDYLARPLTTYVYRPGVYKLPRLTGHSRQWTPASAYRSVDR